MNFYIVGVMKREIILTADGSHTVQVNEMNVTYHSHHGAVQESRHVFVEAGFLHKAEQLPKEEPMRIFEMGFGTGLNALLTLVEAEKLERQVRYTAIENFPLSEAEASALNYAELVPASKELFKKLHGAEWNVDVILSEYFTVKKIKADLLSQPFDESFHLIYYDAFAPAAQPELWTEEIFRKLFQMLLPGEILVTYCSKGDVRRAMMAACFLVQKIPGPKGKREMVRATRPPHPGPLLKEREN